MSIVKKILGCIDNSIIPFFGRLCVSKNKYCNVIYYHDVVDGEGFSFMKTKYDVFVSQMLYLKEHGYQTLRFDDLNDETVKFRKKRVLIAFDDGWRSNFDKIFEFMKANGLKYNIFLTMGEIGHNPDYLTWGEVCRMHKSGLCGFGAHTYTHPDMSDISKISFEHEIDDADALFEKELGYRPLDFCYPFGYYSEMSNIYIEKNADYKRIYTSKKMYSYNQNGCFVFGRNAISNDDGINIFLNKTRGYYNFRGIYERCLLSPLLSLYHVFHNNKK